jgi:hypothetical protein
MAAPTGMAASAGLRTAGSAILDWILAPGNSEVFFASHYEQGVFHANREDQHYWGSLLSIADLDAVLGHHQIKYPDVRLVQSGKPISSDDYTWQAGIIDPLAVARLHSSGATVIFSHLQDRTRALADFVNELSTVFSAPVQANVYLTPANAQGFPAHWDTHDVLILQMSGSKTWRIYEGGPSLTLRGQHFEREAVSIGPATEEFEIKAGGVAYVPRGVIHSAHATAEASLHITVGILSYTWADLLLEAVANVALRDPRFRRSVSLVPETWDSACWRQTMAAQWNALSEAIDLRSGVSSLQSDLLARQKPNLGNLLTQASRVNGLRADSVVSMRPGAQAIVADRDDKIQVEFIGQTIECPAAAGPFLARLLDGTPLRIEAIPGDLELEEKLVLARRFVREGLLEVHP